MRARAERKPEAAPGATRPLSGTSPAPSAAGKLPPAANGAVTPPAKAAAGGVGVGVGVVEDVTSSLDKLSVDVAMNGGLTLERATGKPSQGLASRMHACLRDSLLLRQSWMRWADAALGGAS